MAPTNEHELYELIRRGENERVEFKKSIPSVFMLAQLVSAFANTSGGNIIVGIDDNGTIVGCDERVIRKLFDRIKDRLEIAPNLTMHVLPIESKTVAIIDVPKSPRLIVTDAGAYIRPGGRMQPMQRDEIASKVVAEKPNEDKVTAMIDKMTTQLSELHSQMIYAKSWKARISGNALSFIGGCIIGFSGNWLFKLSGL